MTIIEKIISKGQGVRTGHKLNALKGLVVHWIGVEQPSAKVIYNNFKRSSTGTHYVIDYNDGSIIHLVPDNEVCYHVGASSGFKYTDLKKSICGSKNPNWYFVGIECCISKHDNIPDDYAASGKYMDLGKPSDVQYKALAEFCADFLIRHNLTTDNLYLHNDITNKHCHLWFVKDRNRWEAFKLYVSDLMEDMTMTKEKFNEMLNEVDPIYLEMEDVPDYWKQDVQDLIDAGAIKGDGINKVAKRRSVLEAAIVAKRYSESK